MLDRMELEKYADVLVWALATSRKEAYTNNDVVQITFDAPALPLAELVYERLVDKHLHVIPRMTLTTNMETVFFGEGSYRQLQFVPPGHEEYVRNLNGLIRLLAPDSLTHLALVDPDRFGVTQKAHKPYRDIMDAREERGAFGWTLCLYPTPALAEAAGLTLDDYAAQIRKACYLGQAQPEQDWQQIYNHAQEIKDWLNSLDVREVRIESDNVDLRLEVGESRRFVGVTGHNIPSFEIYTSPDWRGTEGVYYANMPSYKQGNLVRGAKLTFRDGNVLMAEAEKGERFLHQQLNMDPGARRVGEFSLTDRRFSQIDTFMAHTLYDENYGGDYGNCHIAVGSSYADTYAGDPEDFDQPRKEALGFNNSAQHWDLINTEPKRVTARVAGGSAKVIYENGEFAR